MNFRPVAAAHELMWWPKKCVPVFHEVTDQFVLAYQFGTSIILAVNNTSLYLILIKRPIWVLFSESVKAQAEPYLHTEWKECFNLINKSGDALSVSVKQWECFPLELKEDNNEEREMRLEIWLSFCVTSKPVNRTIRKPSLRKQIRFAYFTAHKPFTFLPWIGLLLIINWQ